MKNSVKVIFKDSKYNYETSVSDQTTEKDARNYFVNALFNMGSYPKEDLQICIDIKFNKRNERIQEKSR